MTRRAAGWRTFPQQSVARAFRRKLTLLLLLALPAALAVGVVAASRSLTTYRSSFEARLLETARTTALAVDARLSAYRAAVTVLSLAPELQPGGDPRALYLQARAVGEALGGWVVITAPGVDRRQIVNTLLAANAVLPERVSPEVQAAMVPQRQALSATRQPVVTDMFLGPAAGRSVIAVAVPVVHDGVTRLVVNFTFEPASLSQLLAGQGLPPGVVAEVHDGHRQVIARSADPEQVPGRTAPAWMIASEASDHGMVEGMGQDGRPSLFAFQKLQFAGLWRVVVEMPLDRAAAAATRPLELLLMVVAGVVAVLTAALGLVWLGRRDDRSAYAALDRLLADVPAIITVNRVQPDGRVARRFLSRSAVAITGWPWDVLRPTGAFAALFDPASADLRGAYLLEVLGSGRAVAEYRLRHAGGDWRWVRGSGTCVERAADGSGIVVSCITDITEERSTKERMHQLERLATLGEIATGIAHEMSQPLTGIAMAAENGLLAVQGGNVATLPAKLQRIIDQAHRLAGVIEHVRLFGRTQTDHFVDSVLAGIVNAALVLADSRLRTARTKLMLDLPPDLPHVLTVPVLLAQVLMNLMVNACDAYCGIGLPGGEASPERCLRIAARRHGDRVLVTVADHAGGIPASVLDRMFDPFFTTKPVGQGTGLGLSISYATVTELGGQITARNEGGGAVIEIDLPLGEVGKLGTPGNGTPVLPVVAA